jgi:hypothetical protein
MYISLVMVLVDSAALWKRVHFTAVLGRVVELPRSYFIFLMVFCFRYISVEN